MLQESPIHQTARWLSILLSETTSMQNRQSMCLYRSPVMNSPEHILTPCNSAMSDPALTPEFGLP